MDEGRLVTADGRTLAWTAYGTGPPLILHGGGPGGDPGYLLDLPPLEAPRTVVALHARGTGASTRPKSYELRDYAADLEALRQHLGIERMDVLGHSHGGFVAITWAAANPERVGRLILANTHARFHWVRADGPALIERHVGESWFADATAAHARRIAEIDELSDADLATLYARAIPLLFSRVGARETALTARIATTFNGDALRWFNTRIAPTFDLRPLLASVTAPTLVIAGEHDPVAPPSAGLELANRLPEPTLTVIPNSGHFTAWESDGRAAFAQAVSAFLAAATS
jgi:pimeloyl-ACP methyl ester carboxylesterase